MKIVKVSLTRYRVPFVLPYVTAAGSATHREGFILQLETDDGLRGVGEASMLPDREANLDAFEEALRFDVAGAVGTELIAWLEGFSVDGGRRAQAALSCAAADAFGRALDVSLAHLVAKGIGRDADKSVAVNALVTGGSINEIVASAAAAVEQGYGTLKLKVGMQETVRDETARIAAVREAVRPSTYLRLDANGAWDVNRAIDVLQASGEYNIEYVEQPVPAGDLEAMARVRLGVATPNDATLGEGQWVRIAADEDVTDAASARRVFNAAAADVIVVKPLQAGGLKDWIRLLELSPGDAVVTTSIDTGVGTALALHLAAASGATYAHGLSTLPLLEDDLIVQKLPVVQGRLNMPSSPGLGVELDEAALERYAVSHWQAP